MSISSSDSLPSAPFGRALLLSAIAGVLFTAFQAPALGAEPPTGEQVKKAIHAAVDYLRGRQKADGSWPDYGSTTCRGGVTGLVCYALLQAGVSPDDKAVSAGLEVLGKAPDEATYVVALKAMAFSAAGPDRYREGIQAAADWLVQMQRATGAWGYGIPPESAGASSLARGLRRVRTEAQLRAAYERTDASNTQFALLGLAEATRAGAHVSIDVWRRADRHLRATQLPGGGWGYVYRAADPQDAYGSITAASLAGLYLCAERLAAHEPPDTTADRAAVLERGLEWIARRYTLDENPNRGAAWYYFWLYALERAGVLSGRRTFGDHDWFREGTALLVRTQNADGAWGARLYQNALALLFLAKGFKPLLVQRLEWQGEWRRDPRDLDHLTRFLGTRMGGQVVAWQTLPSESALADYLAAPILHVAGRGPLAMPAATAQRLKAYVEQGGLVLFDPEGGDAAFVQSVRVLAGRLWPEAAFEPLTPNHPIYRSAHAVPPAGLEALRLGCRASVLLTPKGLANAWAAADPERANDWLRLGENLAVYATGGDPLPDRLHEARLLEMPEDETPPRGALRIGQVQHNGDWRSRPFAMPKLLQYLAENFGVSVYSRPVPVRLDESRLGTFPALYLVGHYTFSLSEAEREALEGYLDRGGFLLAEACCGRAAFDGAFRALMKDLFPDAALQELPADHPIYSGKVGPKIERISYSADVAADSPDLDRPVLYGLVRNGHLVVVYSPYGIGAGLDGIRTYGARCLAPADAKRLAANILLYALTD